MSSIRGESERHCTQGATDQRQQCRGAGEEAIQPGGRRVSTDSGQAASCCLGEGLAALWHGVSIGMRTAHVALAVAVGMKCTMIGCMYRGSRSLIRLAADPRAMYLTL